MSFLSLHHAVLHHIYFLLHTLQLFSIFFFFNDTATTEIYTLSLHDALPICSPHLSLPPSFFFLQLSVTVSASKKAKPTRSEEHTSELQSQFHLVCRLLLEKKKKKTNIKVHVPKPNKTIYYNI